MPKLGERVAEAGEGRENLSGRWETVAEYAITFPTGGRKDGRKRKVLKKREQRELDGKLQDDVAGFE